MLYEVITLSRSDRSVISVLENQKTLLETTYVPKLDETAIKETLVNYRDFRENQIRNEIQNYIQRNNFV